MRKPQRTILHVLTAILAVVTHQSFAAAVTLGAEPLPKGGTDILGDPIRRLQAKQSDEMTIKAVAVDGMPFKAVVELENTERPKFYYAHGFKHYIQKPIQQGDTLHLRFWVRALKATAEDGAGKVAFKFREKIKAHKTSVHNAITFGDEWMLVDQAFKANGNYQPGEAAIEFMFGYYPQRLQLGGIQLVSYGRSLEPKDLPMTSIKMRYLGMEADAPWREQAQARIEKIRKGDFELRLTKDGQPVAKTEVELSLERHDYRFGVAARAAYLNASQPPQRWMGTPEDMKKYRELLARHFNYVVFENAMKWRQWNDAKKNPPSKMFSLAHFEPAFAFLKKHRIPLRGHALAWGVWTHNNKPLHGKTQAEQREVLFSHIEEIMKTVGNNVTEWDTVNHPVAPHGKNGKRLPDYLGEDIYGEIFNLAHQIDPTRMHWINEAGRSSELYYQLIKQLLDQGAPVQGIGFMCHFNQSNLTPPEKILAILDRFGSFGLPLLATELDITAEDQEGQAAFLRDFMTAWFSHPQTVGILQWGFWEKAHWRKEAALWDAKWNLRPVGQAYLDLIHREWTTKAETKTGDDGAVKFRGFYGEYRVEVEVDGKTVVKRVNLVKGAEQVTLALDSEGDISGPTKP